jgi:hydrogenase nickel incorporation protein HypA/HybF
MHELSIALNLIDGVIELAAGHPGTVRAVHIRLGARSGVVAEALESAFVIARHGTCLEHAELKVEKVPARGRCGECHTEYLLLSDAWVVCAVCGSPVCEVVGGRELEITALEMEDSHE